MGKMVCHDGEYMLIILTDVIWGRGWMHVRKASRKNRGEIGLKLGAGATSRIWFSGYFHHMLGLSLHRIAAANTDLFPNGDRFQFWDVASPSFVTT